MDGSLKLPARLDSSAAQKLAKSLTSKQGHPILIDASDVSIAGALGIQVLISARRQWCADDLGFTTEAPSNALLDSCRVLGICPTEIGADMEDQQ